MTRLSEAQVRKLGILPTKKPKPVRVSSVQWDARLIPGGVWLQIPHVPPSLNVWKKWHWSKEQEYKQELTDAIRGLVMAMRLPWYRLATVQVIIYFSVRRIRDPADNFAPKQLMDALVQGGILEDDRGDWVQVMVTKLEIDRERPRTEVFIWEE
ncbi:MAG TPA: hypothetical protein DEF34_03255 [Desulfotomaculum sp.]|nr:MAG: hypothetical protein JL56_02875 [Desulfotomaculum sp. BICA1-6]HBX22645.1 hypothetical protein [Desulfotomaculum sp.]